MADTSVGVQLFSQGVFSPPADSADLVAASPAIDLTATAGGGNAVYIWRRGGEVVSKLSERNKKVQAVAWKADGQFLAIAWNDGVVRLVGLESSKAVHLIRLFEGEPSTVTFISWSKNLVGIPETWQAKVLETLGEEDNDAILDLPRTLMFLEVEDDLPKLLPLPVSGGLGTSLEVMFPALKPSEGGAIHIMVLGTDDGGIHVCIYDTFVMGTFKVPLPLSSGTHPEAQQPLLRLRGHANHPASSTHSLLLSNEDADVNAVYLIPMDFSFIFSSPLNLSLLDYKATTFQKILRYIKQTQIHMQGEWQAARELPARFLVSIQEDLQQEPRFKTIDQALRVAALTGYVPPALKLWLVETISERGHKRWDKAVMSGLENLRDLIHENMMPALDRASLALSRLQGLAEFHSDDDIGFTGDQIGRLINMLSCLIVASHNALALVTSELELFVMFSAWLRLLIERLALPGQAEEQAEKEPVMNVTPVLDYITNHLLSSPLDLHFGKTATADWDADWKAIESSSENLMDKLEAELEKVDNIGVEDGLSLMPKNGARKRRDDKASAKDATERQGKRQSADGLQLNEPANEEDDGREPETQGGPGVEYMKAFPKFEFLTKLLATHADRTLKDIAESGRRHVHFGPVTRLDVGAPVKQAEVAMKAVLKTDLEESADVLAFTVITSDESTNDFRLFRTAISTSGGISTAVSTQVCAVALAGNGSITDIRFLGAELILVLWTWTASDRPPLLVAIPVQSPSIRYEKYTEGSTGSTEPQTIQLDHGTVREGGGLTSSGLCWVADLSSAGSSGRVVRMEVLGPKTSDDGSGTPARVQLLYADGATYRAFALPSVAEMFDGRSA
ncbi:anaphase-promoting complex component cut20 [Grosmannia clavigera kw1407]|uniref:Anaphase-promoting complex subunit 4 n=1 Tax=Grosmannia clavigera (strain kw1407 / UAMH 11150) TaxID=655863 RepID=F0XF96_GROCL|nr:anaphase-promoting complex component cut20 [Grosmannia clavigera kw1407]EFX04258.1 anaphase-promoting complex component cut20 [Grosmannia clavigera kw1407]